MTVRSRRLGTGHGHSHHSPLTSERRLWIALALTFAFLVVEVVASVLSGSLALLSDAGHMATDVAALGIALLAIRLGKRPADAKRSFGYRRLEILAAALNAAGLFLVAAYVMYESAQRFATPEPVDSRAMLAVATLGLVVNAIAMGLLRGGSHESLNVRGAYLEVWADFLGSIAVLVGAALIWVTGRTWIDPAVALLIALWVLPRSWRLLKSALHVLLEGTPEGLDPETVRRTLLAVPNVVDVHDLHIWSVTTGVPLLSAHLKVRSKSEWETTLLSARAALESEHHIGHATLQVEADSPCASIGGCAPCR